MLGEQYPEDLESHSMHYFPSHTDISESNIGRYYLGRYREFASNDKGASPKSFCRGEKGRHDANLEEQMRARIERDQEERV